MPAIWQPYLGENKLSMSKLWSFVAWPVSFLLSCPLSHCSFYFGTCKTHQRFAAQQHGLKGQDYKKGQKPIKRPRKWGCLFFSSSGLIFSPHIIGKLDVSCVLEQVYQVCHFSSLCFSLRPPIYFDSGKQQAKTDSLEGTMAT